MLRLLGEVTAQLHGRPVELGHPRQRCVLAALAVEQGRVVPTDRLIERVWGPELPQRGAATLHSYLSRLRQALADLDGLAIVRRSGGYALTTTAAPLVDLHQFRTLCATARAEGDPARAAQLLTEALALWSGDALTGLDGEWAETERTELGRERLAAQHDLVDARLQLGQGARLVVELAARTQTYPLDERVAGQYLSALHQAGRTADALEHYQRIRAQLVDQLGTDPGAALRAVHQQLLSDSPTPVPTSAVRVVPRQLPAAPAPFVGRREDLDRLDAVLAADGPGSTVVISAIAGAGGIGKTWLALHWAHRHVERFPDGQLFVDLQGFSADSPPMEPAVAVRGFLDALGVDPAGLPAAAHAQAALFRSLVADRRMLLVLDNAADTTQLGPLLPGGRTCTVLVTSRNRLPGLLTGHGARHLPLDALPDTEAHALLRHRLGAIRVRREPAAVRELVLRCNGFPLALSIIASHACTRADLPLTALAAELRDLGLSALEDTDPSASLPAVLSWSHRALTSAQQQLFALLGIVPGTDLSLPAAASLAGLPLGETRTLLRGLEQASLITQNAAGRYGMHDLIRAYAADTARRLPEQVCEAALHRILDFHTHTAHEAARLLDTHHAPVPLTPPAPGTHRHRLTDAAAAMAWFDAECATLLAAARTAQQHQRHHTVWSLALALDTFLHRRGHRHERLTVWRAATEAAAHLPDPTPLLIAHRHLGRACAALGLHQEAVEYLHCAISLAEEHDDPNQRAHAHQALARVWGRREPRLALDHATRALRLFATLDLPLCQAHGHNAVGWHTARLGDHDTARHHFHAALALYHQGHRNPTGEANTLDSLGYLEHHAGEHHRAIQHYQQALTLRRDLGDVFDSASTLEHLGHPYAALGQREQARAAWQEALELYQRQGRDRDVQQVRRQLDALELTEPVR